MGLHERLQRLADLASIEFKDILAREPLVLTDRIRLFLTDESLMDIRYPLDQDYSFHWERKSATYRINTAPDHPEIKSYPRHLHNGFDEKVVEDTITSLQNTPEQNLRRVLNWVRDKLSEQNE